VRTLKTDENNDIVVGAADSFEWAVDVAAVQQTAEHYAATARAEMIHNFDEGIPFFQTVFARDVSIPQFEAALRRRLLQAPGVLSIVELETVQTGDVLSYTATIETTYGRALING